MKDLKGLMGKKHEDEANEYGEASMDELWDSAYAKVKPDLKFDPEKQKNLSGFSEARTPIAQSKLIFREWRHPDEARTPAEQARDRNIRENVQTCLNWAQQACSFVQSHSSGTYAQPVDILMAGIIYLIDAVNAVSQDLTAIDDTFESISKAMKSINVFENHAIITLTAKEALVGVFIAMLQFCSYVGADIRAQSRLKMWSKKLLNIDVDKTTTECTKVEKAITEFNESLRFETANDAKEIREGVNWMIKNTNTKMQQSILLSSVSNLTNKGNVLDKLASALQSKLNLNLTLMSHMATRMDTNVSRMVHEVFKWLGNDPTYKEWLEQPIKGPFLHVIGGDGVGKTFLTSYCYELIPQTMERKHSLAEKQAARQQLVMTYFLFEPGFRHFQNLSGVIASILFQIAAQDPKWCDTVATNPELHSNDPAKVWKDLILKRFSKRSSSSDKLFILLDGLTEMQPEERKELLNLFSQTLEGNQHRIWILFTWTGTEEDVKRSIPDDGAQRIIQMSTLDYESVVRQLFISRKQDYDNLAPIMDTQEKWHHMVDYLIFSCRDGNLSNLESKLELLDETLPDRPTFRSIVHDRESDDLTLLETELSGKPERLKAAVKRLVWCCAFAKQSVSVYELDMALRRDKRLAGLEIDEVLRRCRTILFTQQMLPPNLAAPAVDSKLYWCSQPDYPVDPKPTNWEKPPARKYEYVAFRRSSVRESIQNGKRMFENPNMAKQNIFMTLCDVLCNEENSEVDSVHEYAAFHIVSHLRDIDLVTDGRNTASRNGKGRSKRDIMSIGRHQGETTDAKEANSGPTKIRDEDVIKVCTALYKLLSNKTGASSVFEQVQSRNPGSQIDFDLYECPENTAPGQEPNRVKYRAPNGTAILISKWANELCVRNRKSGSQLHLPSPILDWAERVAEQPHTILESLAKGHLRSWAQKINIQEAKTSCFPHWSREYDGINAKVAGDMLGQCRESWTIFAQARLAAALLLHESPRKADQDYAVFLYEKNHALDESMYAERLYSMLSLAECYNPNSKCHGSDIGSWKKVQMYTREALEYLDASDAALRPNLNPEKCKSAYMLHVQACEALGDFERARRICVKALSNKFLKGCRGMGFFLTVLVQIYTDNKDYSNVIQAIEGQIKEQTPLFMAVWLMNRCRYINRDDRLRIASAATGSTDMVIQVYDSAICYWANRGLFHETCVMLYELAVIYRRDCQALKMGEDILNRILEAAKQDESLQFDSTLLSTIISERFDIYYERLSKCWLLGAKRSLCKVAADLIYHPRVADVIESSVRACALITVAKMYREIGNKHDANRHADRAFQICIADLEDWVDDNDMAAFRALAKVLHFGGLHKDAGISVSLIFDRANADALGVSDEDYRDTLSSPIYSGNEDMSIAPESSLSNATSPTADLAKSPTSVSNVTGATLSQQVSETSIQDDKSPWSSAEGEQSNSATTTCSVSSLVEVNAGNGSTIQCMGPCSEKNLKQWDLESEPWYFCVDCPNTDYCNSCYKSLGLQGRSQRPGEWPRSCWGKHTLLPQPMAGWQGVKNGLIRVGSSSRGVREWLEDMKERWAAEMKRNARNPRMAKRRN